MRGYSVALIAGQAPLMRFIYLTFLVFFLTAFGAADTFRAAAGKQVRQLKIVALTCCFSFS
jgi:hypothetical protein